MAWKPGASGVGIPAITWNTSEAQFKVHRSPVANVVTTSKNVLCVCGSHKLLYRGVFIKGASKSCCLLSKSHKVFCPSQTSLSKEGTFDRGRLFYFKVSYFCTAYWYELKWTRFLCFLTSNKHCDKSCKGFYTNSAFQFLNFVCHYVCDMESFQSFSPLSVCIHKKKDKAYLLKFTSIFSKSTIFS